MTTTHVTTLVIGAGQAGLATAYHLSRKGHDVLVLEAHHRIGDIWRNRFDSLRLYSPSKYDGLPGWRFPKTGWSWPTKDEMGDYLEAYAARFTLPVRTATPVERLGRDGDRYVVSAGQERFTADNVVVASGGWKTPYTPDFADRLDPSIRQIHSADYRNPSQLQPGPVLVVGTAHSGADIALETAPTHPTTICGPVRGEIPFAIEGSVARMVVPVMWFAANHVLTERTPVGRKMREHVRHEGGPLLRVKRADLEAAGVTHFPEKVVDAIGGRPMLDGGRMLDVTNVVWCTGFTKDDDWIDLDLPRERGWVQQSQGGVVGHPGLYFVGLPFQYAFASMLVGGVGRDAEQVARHIMKESGQPTAGVDQTLARR